MHAAMISEANNSHRSARIWEKIIVEADSRMSEAIAAFLAELTDSGIEISTSPAELSTAGDSQQPHETITAYLSLSGPSPAGKDEAAEKMALLKSFLERLGDIFPDCPPAGLTTEKVAEEDWNSLWKKFFRAFEVTPTLTIKPSWEHAYSRDRSAGGGHFVIEMDPGMAFGTGHHASTQLALLLLEELFRDSGEHRFAKVLDVGTGSGILAMACALFGAADVLAVDNDPDAVATAETNIKRNGLEQQITVSGRDIAAMRPGFGLIAANIIHDTLAEMAPTLSSLLAPGGCLVLSGILKDAQEDSIRKIYSGMGLRFVKSLTRDEWAALQFQKT